jgi:hypothetical protein
MLSVLNNRLRKTMKNWDDFYFLFPLVPISLIFLSLHETFLPWKIKHSVPRETGNKNHPSFSLSSVNGCLKLITCIHNYTIYLKKTDIAVVLDPVSLGTECFMFQGKNVSCRDKKIKDIELMSWTPVIKEINTIIGRFLGTNVGKKSN